jgi:AAA+ ATPase superfamily predicted ATPase
MASQRHFIGRGRDLARLQRQLDVVIADGRGRLLSIRGRRQAGKSRLVTEFADRTELPQLFFTGARLAGSRAELARFALEAAGSSLPGADVFDGTVPDSWSGALRLLASALPDGPAVIVLDEFPWLRESSPDLESALQVAWDRIFERKPVLFILIGSDISVMEALATYERPLFGRVRELVVSPFELGDTAQMIAVEDPAVAIDAQFVTGGYPRLCAEWRGAADAMTFLRRQLTLPGGRFLSPLLAPVHRTVPARHRPRAARPRPGPSSGFMGGVPRPGSRASHPSLGGAPRGR